MLGIVLAAALAAAPTVGDLAREVARHTGMPITAYARPDDMATPLTEGTASTVLARAGVRTTMTSPRATVGPVMFQAIVHALPRLLPPGAPEEDPFPTPGTGKGKGKQKGHHKSPSEPN